MAVAADAERLYALGAGSSAGAQWSRDQYQAAFRPGSPRRIALIAEDTGSVQGFVLALAATEDWEIENVVVAEAARRHGIGSQLIAELVKHARESRARRLFLEVRASNMAARALYEKAGFAQLSVRRGYYQNPPEGAITYVRNIVAATLESS